MLADCQCQDVAFGDHHSHWGGGLDILDNKTFDAEQLSWRRPFISGSQYTRDVVLGQCSGEAKAEAKKNSEAETPTRRSPQSSPNGWWATEEPHLVSFVPALLLCQLKFLPPPHGSACLEILHLLQQLLTPSLVHELTRFLGGFPDSFCNRLHLLEEPSVMAHGSIRSDEVAAPRKRWVAGVAIRRTPLPRVRPPSGRHSGCRLDEGVLEAPWLRPRRRETRRSAPEIHPAP